jgi:N-acetylmuramoyl-L-alanine amidase
VARLKIVIDAGHGGDDPGAVNRETGLQEADVALQIAQVLKGIMNTHPEFDALLTRDGDRTVPLEERTGLANLEDAYMVSIHCNSVDNPQAHGAEVLCFAEKDKDGSESVGHKVSAAIQGELVALGLRDRGVKPIYDRQSGDYIGRKLWVLRKTQRPAVLVECAFISNPDEARRLGDEHGDFKVNLAVAIFKGIDKTLNIS